MRARLPLAVAAMLAGCAGGPERARDHIVVVGSATVFPFTAAIAERYVAQTPGAAAPIVEATGTRAGLTQFCAGVGADHPDIADASRRMTRADYARCDADGAGALIEVPIGTDGIVFAQSVAAPRMTLTTADLYRALAATPGGKANVARTWRDVDARLPATPILVYGPPATSGTRDVLIGTILAKGCVEADPMAAALAVADPARYRTRCLALRQDGAYADAGENDNLVIRKLQGDPAAIGVFGFSYLVANDRLVRGIAVDGVAPSRAAIADRRYLGARPLYLYAKRAHLAATPGLRRFLALYVASIGPGGPLAARGLIPADAATRARAAGAVRRETPLDPTDLPS